MKINFFILLLFIFFIIKFTNSTTSFIDYNNNNNNNYNNINNNNNTILNYYFSINGNDSNNGSLENPFYSICKLTQLNYQQYSINAFIEYGEYNLNNCILNLNNSNNDNNNTIIINPYNNNNNSNNNTIINLNNFIIILNNLNLIFNNKINIEINNCQNQNQIEFLNSNLKIENNSNLNFKLNYSININYTQIILNDSSKVEFNFNSSNYIHMDNSLIQVSNQSILKGLYIDMNENCKLLLLNSSIIENSYIQNQNYQLYSENSTIKDSIFLAIENVLFEFINSKFQFTKNFYRVFPDSGLIFRLFENSIIILSNCEIISESDENYYSSKNEQQQQQQPQQQLLYFYGFIHVISPSSLLQFQDVSMNNFKSFDSIFRCWGCNMQLLDTQFIECDSPTLIDLNFGKLQLENIQLIRNNFKLIEVNNPSNIQLDNLTIQCENQNIISIISMSQSDNVYADEKTLIQIQNLNIFCKGSFQFKNAQFSFNNVLFQQIQIANVFNVAFNSIGKFNNITVLNSLNSFSTNSYFYIIDQSSFIEISNSSFKNTASLLKSNSESIVVIDSTNITQSTSNSYYFHFENSSLSISNSIISTLSSINSGFMVINSSFLSITDTTIERLTFYNGPIILSVNSIVAFDNILVNLCFSQADLLFFSESNVTILNSIFSENSGGKNQEPSEDIGLDYIMILFFKSINQVNSTSFSSNSFRPLIANIESTSSLNLIELNKNTGSFLSNSKSNVEISHITLYFNKIPFNYFMNFQESSANLSLIYIVNNYFSSYFFSSHNSIVNFEKLLFTNNIVMVGLNSFANSLSFFDIEDQSIVSIRDTFFENNTLRIENFIFINDSTLSIFDTNFINNQLTLVDLYLINANYSNVNIDLSEFSNNFGVGNGVLFLQDMLTLVLTRTIFQNNTFQGSVVDFYPFNTLENYFIIEKSNFSNNFGQSSVLSIDGYYYDGTSFASPNSSFINNTIIDNISYNDGIISTTTFPFSQNMSQILDSNYFNNNTAFYSNTFNSFYRDIVYSDSAFKNETKNQDKYNINSNEELTVYIYVLDYYGNFSLSFDGLIEYKILSENNETINQSIVSNIQNGKGVLKHTFIGQVNTVFMVESKYNLHGSFQVKIIGCQPYQYVNSTGSCSLCLPGYSYSNYKQKCIECSKNYLVCMFNTVYALDNYYIINNDVALVKQCTYQTCEPSNQCTSNLNGGELCNSCFDPFNSSVQIYSKNGIHCCSKFNNWLIIIVLFIFTIFGLVLSFIKYFGISGIVGNIVLFLQINSITFFAYKVYLIPLFQFSWDIIANVCLFKNSNYLYKLLFSYIIIIYVSMIGYSDISLLFIKFCYDKFNKTKETNNKNGNENQMMIIKYPNIINRLLSNRLKKKYIYIKRLGLFFLLSIPILFNSLLVLIPKEIVTSTYQFKKFFILDFSIDYLNSALYIVLATFASIFILGLIILSILFKNSIIIKYKYKNNINNDNQYYFSKISIIIEKLKSKIPFKLSFIGWDFILLLRSFIITILSVTLLYNSKLFLSTILITQLVYTSIYLIFLPSRSTILYKSNNLLNLLQLSIYLVVNSSIFINNTLNIQGIIITTLVISSILIYVFYYLILNYKYQINKKK